MKLFHSKEILGNTGSFYTEKFLKLLLQVLIAKTAATFLFEISQSTHTIISSSQFKLLLIQKDSQ